MSSQDAGAASLSANLENLRAQVEAQGNHVRSLKAKLREKKDAGASKEEMEPSQKEIEQEVVKLTGLKVELKKIEESMTALSIKTSDFNRAGLEALVKRRFVYQNSFEIYGGVKGLYDYGPIGAAVKANIINTWREWFITAENMLEIDCPGLTPEPVLKTSGHTERFTDFMVRDETDPKIYFRADHLLEDVVEKLLADQTLKPETRKEYEIIVARAGEMQEDELAENYERFKITAPTTGNKLSRPYKFNLMFPTQIGPEERDNRAYLRPETAQGMFVNFKRLLEFNQGKMPFAAAQIGNAYRNEIAPRSGLLRVREFTMAEIEHFVHADKKDHPKFKKVANVQMLLLPRTVQMDGGKAIKMAVGDAVEKGIINNQTLAYFMARTHLFMLKIGIREEKLRFRQHLANEMAHYATDCWDAEIQSSYGWVECVGHADRSAYDLSRHSEATKEDLTATEVYDVPKEVDVLTRVVNRQLVGQTFKKDAKSVQEYLETCLKDADAEALLKKLQAEGSTTVTVDGGREFKLTKEMFSLKTDRIKKSVDRFVPNVIEPSFGVGRILYSLLEHCFYIRESDEDRGVLGFKPNIAPLKCSVLPISSNTEFDATLEYIAEQLRDNGISNKVDDSSAALGKRYARTDEIGIPFGITVDFDTKVDNTVTLRERDSMQQIRANVDTVIELVIKLVNGKTTWEQVTKEHKLWESKSEK